MLEKFLTAIERIADSLEIIASIYAGNGVPRIEGHPAVKAATKDTKATAATETKETAAQKKAREKAEKEAAAAKEAEADPMGGDEADPLGGGEADKKKEYSEEDVREMLSKLIAQDGKAAALKVLNDHGAANFTKLPKEKYEDVYVAVQEMLG